MMYALCFALGFLAAKCWQHKDQILAWYDKLVDKI